MRFIRDMAAGLLGLLQGRPAKGPRRPDVDRMLSEYDGMDTGNGPLCIGQAEETETMNEPKYTKAPWRVVRSQHMDDDMGVTGEVVHLVIGQYAYPMAVCGVGCDKETNGDFEEREADAVLASCSPELLESEIMNLPLLQAALEAFEGMLELYRTDKDVQAAVQEYPMALPPALEETVDSLRARIRAVRRLIEKAQGVPAQAMEQKTKEKQ